MVVYQCFHQHSKVVSLRSGQCAEVLSLGRWSTEEVLLYIIFQVILSYGTHLYLDHPQEPDPEERGLYWAARYIDTERIYKLISNNIYAAEEVDLWGNQQKYDYKTAFEVEENTKLKKKENIIGKFNVQ